MMAKPTEQTGQSSPALVLYDGICNLCNRYVLFVVQRDPRCHFRFVPMQSEKGRYLLEKFDLPKEGIESLVLIEGGSRYTKSSAALRIARRMKGLWPILYAFIAVPKPARDYIYDFIARNRYRFFGKQDSCMIQEKNMLCE